MFKEEIKESLSLVLKKLQIKAEDIPLEHPAEESHGDYSTNIALISAKSESPKEMAEKVKAAWEKEGLPEFVDKIEVAGPGFLNIWLKIEYLSTSLSSVLTQGDEYGKSKTGRRKTVVIDYSSPNIAKAFGIGHLRSINIGQALYNLYQFTGWRTIGDNHLGDWGTQFGKLICQIERKNKKEKIKNGELTINDLEELYVEFHRDMEKDPQLEDEARKWFRKLEDGDPKARKIWQACVDVSLKEFGRIYQLLNVKIDFAHGESFYLDKMEAVLADCRKKGILQESQGAQVVEIPGEPVPGMLVKSDGATTYLLRDLATIKFRMEEWNPDLYIYEVGADQTFYFRQVFAVAEKLGYGKPSQFVHISHGLIRWPTGKFSTRKGDTIHLEEVLSEAIEQARALCQKAGVAKDLSEKEREAVAQAVGVGGVKYNDLKQNPKTDVIFDWEQILSLSGNSGPYLQYTYARTQSVQRKAKSEKRKVKIDDAKGCLNAEEIALLRTIYKFPEIVAEAAGEYSPNLICNFLFDLARKFNHFYDKHRIIGEENEEFRLLLTAAVGQVLKNGLNLLGIRTLERM